MSRVQRYAYLGATALLALLCLLLLIRSNRALADRARAEAELQAKLSRAEAEILSLRQEVADLKGQLLAARAGRPAGGAEPLVLLNAADLAELKAQGLKEPAADLVRALQERPDLIPMKAVLGGTMAFDPPGTWAVSRPWILASFSDGHVGGRGLFRYEVEAGRITFTLVEWIPF